jgi:hypothetical protein
MLEADQLVGLALVINSQNEGHVDFNLPDMVAHRFEPGERLMLQTHYVNASTQKTPGVGRIFVNFNRTPASVSAVLGTAFATNQSIRICPGETKSFEATCSFARNHVTIFGANGPLSQPRQALHDVGIRSGDD